MAQLLNHLGQLGYRVSPNKAQLSKSSVIYLQFILSPKHEEIIPDCKTLIASMPIPTTKQALLCFLGLAGYFRIWIPNSGLIAKPLYDAAKGPLNEPLPPNKSICQPVKELKKVLTEALALAFPNLEVFYPLYGWKARNSVRVIWKKIRTWSQSNCLLISTARPYCLRLAFMPEGPGCCSNTYYRGPKTYLFSTYNCLLPPCNSRLNCQSGRKIPASLKATAILPKFRHPM